MLAATGAKLVATGAKLAATRAKLAATRAKLAAEVEATLAARWAPLPEGRRGDRLDLAGVEQAHLAMTKARELGALLLAGMVLLAVPAAGDDRPRARPIHLVYTLGPGARGCPGAEALEKAVAAELEYDPFDGAAARKLAVSIGARGGKLAGDMELRNEAGELLWEHSIPTTESCAELVLTLALAIAIRIEAPSGPPPCPVCPTCAPPTAPLPGARREDGAGRRSRARPQRLRFQDGPVPLLGRGPLLLALESPLVLAPGLSPVHTAPRSDGRTSRSPSRRARCCPAREPQGKPGSTRRRSGRGDLAPCAISAMFFGCGLIEGGVHCASGPDAPPQEMSVS